MAETSVIPRENRGWIIQRLSGLAISLEVLMELQAILNELVEYHSCFEKHCVISSECPTVPIGKTTQLSRQVQRLIKLRDATRNQFFSLGAELLWCGFSVDDLEKMTREHFSMSGPKATGFDRGNMITRGKEILSLLRESKSIVAAVEIAARDVRDVFRNYQENAESISRAEALAFELMDNLAYWAVNDIDRVRDLFQSYSYEIALLEEQQRSTSELKT